MKNTLAPVNRIPLEVPPLIPDCCDTDDELVALTHVCRGSWTCLGCASVEKTRVYLERSKTFPLEIWLGGEDRPPVLNDVFLSPNRHKTLTLSGSSNNLQLSGISVPVPYFSRSLTSLCPYLHPHHSGCHFRW